MRLKVRADMEPLILPLVAAGAACGLVQFLLIGRLRNLLKARPSRPDVDPDDYGSVIAFARRRRDGATEDPELSRLCAIIRLSWYAFIAFWGLSVGLILFQSVGSTF